MTQLKITLPSDVDMILQCLDNMGYEAFCVGGCVRDSILGKMPKDWDVCTNATTKEIVEVFKDYRVIETGLKFGTVTVMINDIGYEITTYRSDGEYKDGRKPDYVTFVKNVEEDVKRRDISINGLLFSPKTGLVDYIGGYNDIKSGIIRAIGDPIKRLDEDALRILRVLRFSSVLGFTINNELKKALMLKKEKLSIISRERIGSEFAKILMGVNAKNTLMENREIIAEFIPEVVPMFDFEQKSPYHIYDIYEHTVVAVEKANKDEIIKLAMFFHDIGKPETFSIDENGVGHFYGHAERSLEIAKNALTRLRFSKDMITEVLTLIQYHDIVIIPTEKAVKRLVYKFGINLLTKLINVKRADILAQGGVLQDRLNDLDIVSKMILSDEFMKEPFTVKNLNIKGTDVIALGVPSGKRIGDILKSAFDKVLDGELINDRDLLLKYIETLV